MSCCYFSISGNSFIFLVYIVHDKCNIFCNENMKNSMYSLQLKNICVVIFLLPLTIDTALLTIETMLLAYPPSILK
jgi:hypothetical protein